MAKSKSTLAELTGCPHCGGENGYHTKEVVDYKQLYCWEGEHTWGIRGSKSYYCCDCGRNITKRITPPAAQ